MKAKSVSRYILIAAGVALLMAGLYNGEQLEVLHKAIRVCFECIGIG